MAANSLLGRDTWADASSAGMLLASDALGFCCYWPLAPVPGDDSAQSFTFPHTPLAGTLGFRKNCINRLLQSKGPGGHYPAARLPIRSQGSGRPEHIVARGRSSLGFGLMCNDSHRGL